jgi:hypothetical protein
MKARTTYADQRAHDAAWMTVAEREQQAQLMRRAQAARDVYATGHSQAAPQCGHCGQAMTWGAGVWVCGH